MLKQTLGLTFLAIVATAAAADADLTEEAQRPQLLSRQERRQELLQLMREQHQQLRLELSNSRDTETLTPLESQEQRGEDRRRARRARASARGLHEETETTCRRVIEGEPPACTVLCDDVTTVFAGTRAVDETSATSRRECEEGWSDKEEDAARPHIDDLGRVSKRRSLVD